MDIEVLKSYLVSLGFEVNQPQLSKFQNSLRQAASMVEGNTTVFLKDLFKWQGALVGAFTGISTGILAMAEHVSEADQKYRLMGMRMFMSTEQARKLSIATRELGASLEEIAWDPELHARFLELSALQDKLSGKLGGSFSDDMRKIRDFRFELTKLKVSLEFLGMKFVQTLFQEWGLTAEDVGKKIEKLTDWVADHLPEIAKQLSDLGSTILKDTGSVLKELGQSLLGVADALMNLWGAMNGNDKIQSMDLSVAKLGETIKDVSGFMRDLSTYISNALGEVAHLANAIAALKSGDFKKAAKEGGLALGTAPGEKLDPVNNAAAVAGDWTHKKALELWGKAKDTVKRADDSSLMHILDQIKMVAKGLQIDPKLLEAIGRQESRLHEYGDDGKVLTSNKGARGVMQLMPETAKGLHVDPTNTDQNILGGGKLLAELLKRYHGNVAQALAAYNWNPKGLDEAIKRHGKIPQETLNYVQAIEKSMGQNVTIGDVQIQILQPNANPDQIHQEVKKGILDGLKKQQQRNTAQFGYAGG